MAAGRSAGEEARRQAALAAAHEQAAALARAAAGRFSVAEATEKRTAVALSPLTARGHYLLADRRWPGSRDPHAQVDLVVVGPGGVFIVDTKAWRNVAIHGERVLRDQEDVTDDLRNLADLGSVVEGDLAEVGLAPGEVHPVVVLAGRSGIDHRIGAVRIVGEKDVLRHVASYGARLTDRQVESVLVRSIALLPRVGAPAPVVATVPEPVLPEPRDEFEPDALLTEQEVSDALLAGALARPIEEWMSYLHPAQAKLVRRSFNGPARIRGAAGTGKTVVGLHRAAYLARTRPGRVLVTTFVRTLPDVLAHLLERMAPDVVDKVEFAGVHGWARRLLVERGVATRVDDRAAREALHTAWRSLPVDGLLHRAPCGRDYWRDEISKVIKGRGITTFDAYADLARSGRRYPLNLEQRREVWALYTAYQRELAVRGVQDFDDQILLAEAELRRLPSTERYSAVIVDEAQDLSAAMVRMVHALVGDAPDGLMLIGDGQQAIYPGGYTLAEAGVSVAGRGVVLDVNYRNTVEILEFASSMVAGDEVADIDGAVAKGDRAASVARRGPEPVVVRLGSAGERTRAMIERVRAVAHEVGTATGGVGVLCATNASVARAAEALRTAGAKVIMLTDYDGAPVDAIRVGTIKRAKGLEFAQVLLPDVAAGLLDSARPPGDTAERERWELDRRELYVAMTRARDGLWVAVGEPSSTPGRPGTTRAGGSTAPS